jgi:hypothetical protein
MNDLVMNDARISLESMKGSAFTPTNHFSPARELRDPARAMQLVHCAPGGLTWVRLQY